MDPIVILLAALAGLAILAIWFGAVLPPGGRRAPLRARVDRRLTPLQRRLDAAQMEVKAGDFVRRGTLLGLALGLGLSVLVGAVSLFPVGLVAGYLFAWSALERARDLRLSRYTRLLAQACDVIRNSYSVKPSLQKALEAAAIYCSSPVKEDFGELLIAYMQGDFERAVEALADRRRSIVFDGVANALLRADRAGSGVSDMLARLAISTRENVAAFEDALIAQINARSNVQWGTFGPWGVFAVFRVLSLAFSMTNAGGAFGGMTTFFSTPAGNLIALLAALISLWTYLYCDRLARRGLIVRRVKTADALAATASAAQMRTEANTGTGAPLRGQRPLVETGAGGGR